MHFTHRRFSVTTRRIWFIMTRESRYDQTSCSTPRMHSVNLVFQTVPWSVGEGAKSRFPFKTHLLEKRDCELMTEMMVCCPQTGVRRVEKSLPKIADSKNSIHRAHLPGPRPDMVEKARTMSAKIVGSDLLSGGKVYSTAPTRGGSPREGPSSGMVKTKSSWLPSKI